MVFEGAKQRRPVLSLEIQKKSDPAMNGSWKHLSRARDF